MPGSILPRSTADYAHNTSFLLELWDMCEKAVPDAYTRSVVVAIAAVETNYGRGHGATKYNIWNIKYFGDLKATDLYVERKTWEVHPPRDPKGVRVDIVDRFRVFKSLQDGAAFAASLLERRWRIAGMAKALARSPRERGLLRDLISQTATWWATAPSGVPGGYAERVLEAAVLLHHASAMRAGLT